jgi:hypothetical protein
MYGKMGRGKQSEVGIPTLARKLVRGFPKHFSHAILKFWSNKFDKRLHLSEKDRIDSEEIE